MSQTVPLINFLGDASQRKAGYKFIIPHYQRGYRWEEQEVTELLDDLWAFCKDLESGDFFKPFEFIRRFLQHVLPSGFMKIRYYGFMHPSSSIPLKTAVVLLEALYGVPSVTKRKRKTVYVPRCTDCQAIVTYLYFIPPRHSPPSGLT